MAPSVPSLTQGVAGAFGGCKVEKEKVPRLETSMVTANRVCENAFWVAEMSPFALGRCGVADPTHFDRQVGANSPRKKSAFPAFSPDKVYEVPLLIDPSKKGGLQSEPFPPLAILCFVSTPETFHLFIGIPMSLN